MDLKLFEQRKADHLRLALDPKNQTANVLDSIHLAHEALPELNLSEISLNTKFWNFAASSPLFISSMTAGHQQGQALNQCLAKVASHKKWPMGIGSQRRELTDQTAAQEARALRKSNPTACFFSNLGAAQIIEAKKSDISRVIESLEAQALIIHLNPLQEALQPEGTTNFKGATAKITELIETLKIPVIVKETGCGISPQTAKRLCEIGVAAIDVAGAGGTHWGRIEGARAQEQGAGFEAQASQIFSNWGINTLDSLVACSHVLSHTKAELWASGGMRHGLDAARVLALGADKVGFAQMALRAALEGEETLAKWMEFTERELKLALFVTGSATPSEIRGKIWQKI